MKKYPSRNKGTYYSRLLSIPYLHKTLSSAARCNTTSANETQLLNNLKTPHSKSDCSLDVANAPSSFSNTKNYVKQLTYLSKILFGKSLRVPEVSGASVAPPSHVRHLVFTDCRRLRDMTFG